MQRSKKNTPIVTELLPFDLVAVNAPFNFDTNRDSLVMVAGAKTDLFIDPAKNYESINAPVMIFSPDEDFIFSATVEPKFQEKWDAGSLVLFDDFFHMIKFAFESDYRGNHRIVSVVTRDYSDDCNSEVYDSKKANLTIGKRGAEIMLFASSDNNDPCLIRRLRFESKNGIKIGFSAQSPVGEGCEVKFTNISYRHKEIADPYTWSNRD